MATTIEAGRACGLAIHRFKRTAGLPRVRRVLGALMAFQPATLLDIGGGRGVFLWPLLDALPGAEVTGIDVLAHRVEALSAVARGGVERLHAHQMDAAALSFVDSSFDAVTVLEVLEQAVSLIRYHQIPFFLLESEDPRRRAHRISQAARCDLLAIVAWADAAGRRCAERGDGQRLMDSCELFDEFCREQRCHREPRAFPSDHSRFVYFRKASRDPDYHPHDDTRSRVTILAGLPAAGKDSGSEKTGSRESACHSTRSGASSASSPVDRRGESSTPRANGRG